MSGTGTYGDYGSMLDYPVGPASWQAGLYWPLRQSGAVYSADLNQQLSQPVSFLARRPQAFLRQQTAQTGIPTGSTPTALTMDTVAADAWGMQSNSASLSQLIVPTGCDGIWLVTGQAPMALAAGTNTAQAAVLHNSSTAALGSREQSPGSYVTPQVADLIACAAGDVLQLAALHNAGSNQSAFVGSQVSPPGYLLSPCSWVHARWMAGTAVTLQSGGVVPAGTQVIPALSGSVTLTVPQLQLAPTSPSTWVDNSTVAGSATMNNDVRGSVLFMSNPPAFRVQQASAAGISSNANVIVTGMSSTPDIDTWGAWSANTWTCPLAGLYVLGAQVGFASSSSAYFCEATIAVTHSATTLHYNGARSFGNPSAGMALRLIRLSAGDTVQLGCYQITGGSLNTVAGAATRLFGVWMGE